MKIGIIKLGAKGDVVRTLSLLVGLKEKYPDSVITWITRPQCKEIIETSPHVSNILTIPLNNKPIFDILYNFDIEAEASDLANGINAGKKYGFCLDQGYPATFNLSAEYYLNTLFDDNVKKSNKKTYQEIMFETAELNYNKQHHPIYLTEQEKEYGRNFLNQNNTNPKKLIGIHIGSSPRWPSKRWHLDNIKEFITKAKAKGYEILLFSGPDETASLQQLIDQLNQLQIKVHTNDPHNTDKEFFSLINLCSKIVTGDTFALHIALALEKPTIGLFFCTSPYEVEDYNLLTKITSPMLYDFFPEKMDQYSEQLTKSISADQVLESLERSSIKDQINQSIEAHKTILDLEDQIQDTANLIINALKNGKKVLSCGNGGSAAQAQHFSAELVGRFEKEREGIPSISLTTDTSNLTAIGNDYGYNAIFKRQVESIGKPNDILICLSSSGNSENLIQALEEAKKKDIKTINLLGKDGGKMKNLADIDIIIDSENTARIQECHILILHILAKLIEDSYE